MSRMRRDLVLQKDVTKPAAVGCQILVVLYQNSVVLGDFRRSKAPATAAIPF